MAQKSKIESRRIFENSSGPSFRNYSLAAPVPVLQGFPTKFLQKIEWKKVACRWRFFETFYQLLCMILDQKPTIPIILDCEQSLRMVTRARKSSEAIESKKQEAEGNHFVLLRLVCPPYNLIAL